MSRSRYRAGPSTVMMIVICLSMLLIQATVVTAAQQDQNETFADQSLQRLQPLPEFPDLSFFNIITERPLFYEDRRPAQKPDAPTGGNLEELNTTWKLTGISITPEKALALFEERQGRKRVRLEVGMLLDSSWLLDEITPDGVSLVSGDQTINLVLRQPRGELPEPQVILNQQAPATDNPATSDGEKAPDIKIPQEDSR